MWDSTFNTSTLSCNQLKSKTKKTRLFELKKKNQFNRSWLLYYINFKILLPSLTRFHCRIYVYKLNFNSPLQNVNNVKFREFNWMVDCHSTNIKLVIVLYGIQLHYNILLPPGFVGFSNLFQVKFVFTPRKILRLWWVSSWYIIVYGKMFCHNLLGNSVKWFWDIVR